jgi:hypothetical protein
MDAAKFYPDVYHLGLRLAPVLGAIIRAVLYPWIREPQNKGAENAAKSSPMDSPCTATQDTNFMIRFVTLELELHQPF